MPELALLLAWWIFSTKTNDQFVDCSGNEIIVDDTWCYSIDYEEVI